MKVTLSQQEICDVLGLHVARKMGWTGELALYFDLAVNPEEKTYSITIEDRTQRDEPVKEVA